MTELTEELNQLMAAETMANDLSRKFVKVIRGLSPEEFWEFLKDTKVPIIRDMPEGVIRILVVRLRDPDIVAFEDSVSTCRSKIAKIEKIHRDFVTSSLATLSDIEKESLARRLDPTLVPREERSCGTGSSGWGGGGGGGK